MTMKKFHYLLAIMALIFCCNVGYSQDTTSENYVGKRLKIYKSVKLTANVDSLSDEERNILINMISAAEFMNEIFWMESYGNKKTLLDSLPSENHKKFAEINYGPWDRLNGNKSFVPGIGPKPAGANFYPSDMTKSEFKKFKDSTKNSQYTVLRRDKKGNLITQDYFEAFQPFTLVSSEMLMQAAEACETDTVLAKYLRARSQAIVEDNYDKSDRLWLDMKDNKLDIIIGPIENYEDNLFGLKTAHEAYVLIKDMAWSNKLAKYVTFLPELQKNLPVDEKYKMEKPGSSSQLNAYDVVYYAGDCNSGSKTIAVNLPNDEKLQKEKGTRRSQLKNAMKAKFDEILLPLSEVLIDAEQRKHVTFDAFFENTMFHEVAHGLGIKETINGKGTVRKALGPDFSALEEGKADVLGLFMVTQLHNKGVLEKHDLMNNYVTFMASIFRSVRFGASSAHGKANMIRFNYFKEQGAFTRSKKNGTYKIDFEKMKAAVNSLSKLILTLQGDGDLIGVKKLLEEKGKIGSTLQSDLDRLSKKGIPVDIVFEQGIEVLGL